MLENLFIYIYNFFEMHFKGRWRLSCHQKIVLRKKLIEMGLKAKAMMGDTGSNVLGISIGILMVLGYTLKVRIVWLVFLVLIHLLTEKFSLTKIIEKNKVLNFIDRLGR